ncbi:glycosyl hydrolase [Aspergillus cavernicola]|uniref:Glycosyl hydrolase n=1 Tax=Aspergillus cavernicola TaxID=176166 RepID=A0ABR4I9F5_9EURO
MISLWSALGVTILVGTVQAALDIVPGATWTATNTGEHIQAHGAGLIEENGIYYMIGEEKTDGSAFQAVNCYSSTNLIEWSLEGRLLSRTEEAGDLGPNRVIERPKVIKNDQTGQYVMWLHVDSSDYRDARVGVATSDSLCGEYEYRESFRPLGFQSRDIGLFKDDDGSAYLLSEDREYGTRVIKLTDDYLNVSEVTFGWEYFAESPALVKHQDRYFIFGSHLTGWDPNDNVYSHAESLEGPWSEWTEFAPVGSLTYRSQVNYVQPLGTDKAIYMGDRWEPNNLGASTYIWLPLKFDGTDVTLDWYDRWTVDVEAGDWYDSVDVTAQEGEDGDLSNGGIVISCSRCTGSEAAGYLGGDEDGTVTFNVDVESDGRVTLVFKYLNGDYNSRFAAVSVNGQEQDCAFLSTAHYSTGTGNSVVHVDLSGGVNIIVVSGSTGWGPDIDQLLVPNI